MPVNALEFLVSTMESEALAGRNVVRLLCRDKMVGECGEEAKDAAAFLKEFHRRQIKGKKVVEAEDKEKQERQKKSEL